MSDTTTAIETPAAHVEQPRSKTVNLVEELKVYAAGGRQPELVQFDGNETPVIPFSAEGVRVSIHFLDDPNYRGYLRCNGPPCLLCRVGRTLEERILVPVYRPGMKVIDVVALTPNMKPVGLKPQLLKVIASGEPKVALIRKASNSKFELPASAIPEDLDDGSAVIADFTKRVQSGESDLSDVYPLYDNRLLMEFQSVASIVKIKGISLDEAH